MTKWIPSLAAIAILELAQPSYDLVIRAGRVIDPETGLDAVRNLGINGATIARVTADPIAGRKVIDASGLVVAPGFIDLHQHQHDPANQRLKALDGVTTALEMEIGVPSIREFLDRQRGSLIHYGATASHPAARAAAFGAALPAGAIVPPAGPATDKPATAEQLAAIRRRLSEEMEIGALGIGMGLAYTPGATRLEVIETFRLAAEKRLPVYTHVRSAGRLEPGSSIESVSEVIAAAAVSGATLHIVHINSSGLRDAAECLRLVEGARARGLDVTTEGYPYGAGHTELGSALFNPGWQERLGISYGDLQLAATGERLTREDFEKLRAMPGPVGVLLFLNPDEIVDQVMTHPLAMIASDGGLRDGKGHPRSAGTYGRILSRYVRERQSLTLMDAIRRASYLPARRLESSTADGRRKGRIQEGADADIVVFDSRVIADRATYASPAEPTVGVRHLLVLGTSVVEEGRVVDGVGPGRPLMSAGGRLAPKPLP